MVFEDMTPKGYAMCDWMSGLDAGKCHMILRWLARLHATSLAFRHKHPKEAERIEIIKEISHIPENKVKHTLLRVVRFPLGQLKIQAVQSVRLGSRE